MAVQHRHRPEQAEAMKAAKAVGGLAGIGNKAVLCFMPKAHMGEPVHIEIMSGDEEESTASQKIAAIAAIKALMTKLEISIDDLVRS